MVGYVRWEEKRKKLTLRRCPLGDGEVCLLEGGGRLNRRVQRRVRQAAQAMADAGVRYAAAPPEFHGKIYRRQDITAFYRMK